jgi:Flp pilus assembly pilin Flp
MMRHFTRRFLIEKCGAAGAEFAILAVVFAGILIAIFDFGIGMYQWNQIEKACQEGARFAVVNDIVAEDMVNYSGIDNGIVAGQPIPLSAFPNPIVCTCLNVDTTGGAPFCKGGVSCSQGAADSAAADQIAAMMASFYPSLGNGNGGDIVITYNHIGMGFAGNPFGPDVWPQTTVEVQDLDLDFATPLVGPLFGSPKLSCSSTLTGEDFQT